MNWLTGSIVLQNEDAWALRVGGIILDHHGGVQSVDDIDHVYAVACEFLVAVKRYPHFAACRERAYLGQRLAQIRDPLRTDYDLGGGLSEFQPSAVRFHDPSACFFRITNHLPLSLIGVVWPGTVAVRA